MPESTQEDRTRVSEASLTARIRRALRHDNEELRTARSDREELDLGRYFTVDIKVNGVTRHDVDLEALGRVLGVLSEHESLAK